MSPEGYLEQARNNLLKVMKPGHDAVDFEWISVLNPNPNEQEAGMSFGEAMNKEDWYFETIFGRGDDDEWRDRCGINNLRSVLLKKYVEFATEALQRDVAPTVFEIALDHEHMIASEWDWTPTEEHYDDTVVLETLLQQTVADIFEGAKDGLHPKAVLNREDLRTIFDECQGKPRPRDCVTCERNLTVPVATVADDCIQKLQQLNLEKRYKRFPCVVKESQSGLGLLMDTNKEYSHATCQREREHAERMLQLRDNAQPERYVTGLVYKMEKLLCEVAVCITALPQVRYIHHEQPQREERMQQHVQQHDEAEPTHTAEPTLNALIELGTPLIEYLDPMWLQEGNLDTEYLEVRQQFMDFRRAAELLRLVFDEATREMAERIAFDGSEASKRSLLRVSDRDAHIIKLEAPLERGSSAQAELAADTFVASGDGSCCGCPRELYRPHEAAFAPCGHTVFCLDCADAYQEKEGCCPVCQADTTGVYLCYEQTSTERASIICRDAVSMPRDGVEEGMPPEPEMGV
jgi:hypothetical protein